MDATMLAFSCGHIVLACRQQMLMTVRAPQFAKQGCGVGECRVPSCKGNRVEEVCSSSNLASTSAAAATAAATGLPTYKVFCAHHKNSSKGQPGWEVQVASPTMAKLMFRWGGGCWVGVWAWLQGPISPCSLQISTWFEHSWNCVVL